MRRFGWLVCVAACHSAAPAVDPCHHASCCGGPILQSSWDATQTFVCGLKAVSPTASACKDGSGHALLIESDVGPVWGFFGADGRLIGSRYETDDQLHATCSTETWGVGLSCDLTPIDLPCAVTN